VAGTDDHFRIEEFADTMRSRLVSVFSEGVATAKIPVLDIATRYSEVGEAILPVLNPIFSGKYGLEMTSFVVENVSVPPEVEQAIDKRSSMAAVGNLNDYVKFQMAQGLEKGAGAGGIGAEMAVGLAMAQQMANQAGGILGQSTPPVAGPQAASAASSATASVGMPDLLGPADVAKLLGVSEDDVMATITAGELKAKKIGSTYRITRVAVDEFLKS
jgi:excisionase family DNA binding protein